MSSEASPKDDKKDEEQEQEQQEEQEEEKPQRRATSKRSRRNSTGTRNSLKFRQVDVDWTPDQLLQNQDEINVEVMDLRPSVHPTVTMMATSSFVSIGHGIADQMSIDSEVASEMFQVEITNNDDGALRNDLPEHWDAAGAATETGSARRSFYGRRSSRESLTSSITSWRSGTRSGGSRSGSGSGGSGESSGVSRASSSNSSNMTVVDVDWKRKMYVRRCAKATFGFLALAALTASVIYFVTDDGDDESLFSFSGNGFLGDLIGSVEQKVTGLDNVNRKALENINLDQNSMDEIQLNPFAVDTPRHLIDTTETFSIRGTMIRTEERQQELSEHASTAGMFVDTAP